MQKKHFYNSIIPAVAVVLGGSLFLAGCDYKSGAANLMTGIIAVSSGDLVSTKSTGATDVTDFGVKLLQHSPSGENTLYSPVSLLNALGMTANGAVGTTLDEMETSFGMGIDDLNEYLFAYSDSLPRGEKYDLSMADSVWIKDDRHLEVRQEYLEKVGKWYTGDVFKSRFNSKTNDAINDWVNESTYGTIDHIIDDIPSDAVMYLINAVGFDAEWDKPFDESQDREGIFTTASDQDKKVTYMHSVEDVFLEDDRATGFMKQYSDSTYAYVALKPRSGISLSEYVSDLTGSELRNVLLNGQECEVDVLLPKYNVQYSSTLNDALRDMGINAAFTPGEADFTGIGTYGGKSALYISDVHHKTYVNVDEMGTMAGAASVVEVATTGALEPRESREVHLTEPFLFMIVDTDAKVPVFMGTVNEL